MRKFPPVKRTIGAVVAATVVGALALSAGTAPVAAAPPSHGKKKSATSTTTSNTTTTAMGTEDSGKSQIQAPPRPKQAVPAERVVGNPAAGRSRKARQNLKDTITNTITNALTQAAVTTNPATKTSSGTAAPAAAASSTKTLVLFDSTSEYGWLGEDYAINATNLVSHFGAWTAHPVVSYTAGELANYSAVVYLGSTYDEPIPVAFLDDVLNTTKPVMWMYDNIWQLTARSADFATKYGMTWKGFDFASVASVAYQGTTLTRDPQNQAGIMDWAIYDPTKVTTVATATRADGTTFPWAVRSGNLTYIGEIPFAYMTDNDRYIAFSDMLYDLLAPTTVARHRAAVRIEDVGPDADPTELKAVANYLYSIKVPFTVAVYSHYRDPKGVMNNGIAEDYTLKSRPQVVTALKYMQGHGGTLLMHGDTHQLDALNNPYDGVSADDFEFYTAHIDANNNVIYDGPAAQDSASWASGRVASSNMDWLLAGLKTPTIFEPPHYAASAVDYQTFNTLFSTRYDRGLYFPGLLTGGTIDPSKLDGQFFPYSVRDVYGTAVIPENIGNIEPLPFNNHPARLPADLIANAKANLAVRDGTASFFYHPYLGTDYLKQTVTGIQGLGYTFVAGTDLLK